jgi:hypothetical protein
VPEHTSANYATKPGVATGGVLRVLFGLFFLLISKISFVLWVIGVISTLATPLRTELLIVSKLGRPVAFTGKPRSLDQDVTLLTVRMSAGTSTILRFPVIFLSYFRQMLG